MKRGFLLAMPLLWVLVIARSTPALADAPPTAAAQLSPNAPIQLDKALAAAEIPKQEVYIAVGAGQVSLPSGSTAPNPGDTVTHTATAYERIVVPFDDIEAIAAPTRVVLNTDPPAPNPYDGMPPSDAFKLLLACLTQDQWNRLTGKIGLSYQDLTTDDQRALFNAVFPVTPLVVNRYHVPGGSFDDGLHPPPSISADALKQAHLRLGKLYDIAVPISGSGGDWDVSMRSSDPAPGYDAQPSYNLNQAAAYGAGLRAIVPNTLKDSDLDFNSGALHAMVNLSGVKTVADLIERIGGATHLEIYADPHHENRAVLLLGSAPARADDLLRALALCVAGAYRRVGAAYVLTDDIAGVGARRAIINNFTQAADASRADSLVRAGDFLLTKHHGVDGLAFLPGDSTMSAAEEASILKQRTQPSFIPGEGQLFTVKYTDLTPAQRDAVNTVKDEYESENLPSPNQGKVNLDGQFLVTPRPEVEMDVPGLDGVVLLSMYFNSLNLFVASAPLQLQIQQKQGIGAAVGSSQATTVTRESLAVQLRPIPTRALLASPRTAADVDSIVASMKTVGLNQLWLDVFSDGVSHLDRPANTKSNDILTEALAQIRGAGIAIIPTLDLLKWGSDTPSNVQDLTVLGENSAQAQTEHDRYQNAMDSTWGSGVNPESPITDIYVEPASPEVRNTLEKLVRKIASTPGIGGIGLRESLANGYAQHPNSQYNATDYTLGYTEPMRLAFLRRTHEDPIDLDPETYGGEIRPDTTLPDFDDTSVTDAVQKEWDIFRADTNQALMTSLWQTAQSAAKGRPLPIWVHNRGTSFWPTWFGIWTDPTVSPPSLPMSFLNMAYTPSADIAAAADSTSRTNLIELSNWGLRSSERFSRTLKNVTNVWAGFVIDASRSEDGDPLADLANALTGVNDSVEPLTSAATKKQ